MAKYKGSSRVVTEEDPVILECMEHYNDWTNDNNIRRTRPNGWDAVTDAYWGKLPSDWPYQSKVVDPCIRTSVIEKKARLLNQKLRGRLVPRTGDKSDMIKARINNALLDFQWDNAMDGGTMLSKWGAMDQDTRLYASRFGLVKWRHEVNDKGEVLFSGNEFYPLDVRDSGIDPACEHIRSAKWFQAREWTTLEQLESIGDLPDGSKVYPGLEDLRAYLENSNDRRDTAYPNRVLQNKGIQDRVGNDKAYPTIEIVTEYRKDRWITFSPKFGCILRDIPNPYKHNKIPIVQLRYYKLTGDPWGESEIEPVLPLWKSIQAIICGFMDNMNIHNRPPLKIIDGQVRIETIVFGPEAQWHMDRQDSVTELQPSGAAMQYFQAAYAAAKSAFNTAMGDISQGVSAVDTFAKDKTATEIRHSSQQQNSRDQDNQTQLAEALEDMMSMWLSNNQQFIFADPEKKEYVLRIVGSDLYNYFQRAGMDEEELTPEAMSAIGDVIAEQEGNLSDDDMMTLIDSGKTPKFPVIENPEEKNPDKYRVKPKMTVNDMGDGAELVITQDDMDGTYDYIADVVSMSSGASENVQKARGAFLDRLTTNPTVLTLLQQQGITPDIKELLVTDAEQAGLTDAERYFPKADTVGAEQDPALQAGQGNIPPQAMAEFGVPTGPLAGLAGGLPDAMAQPNGPQLPPGVPAGIQ